MHPYDENTSVAEQEAVDPASPLVDIMSVGHRAHALAGQLRKLIRAKIADCGDLDQAKEAIKEILKFFKRLDSYVSKRNLSLSSIPKISADH